MKKIFVFGMIFLLFVVGCSSGSKDGVTFIDIKQLETKIDAKEDFVLILGLDTCSACIAYKPTLEEVVKNKDIDIFYVQVKQDWSDAAKQEVVTFFMDKLGHENQYTPTTFFIKDGEIEDTVVGDYPYLELLELLNTKGYVQ